MTTIVLWNLTPCVYVVRCISVENNTLHPRGQSLRPEIQSVDILTGKST